MKQNKLIVDKQTHNYLLENGFEWCEPLEIYLYDNGLVQIFFYPEMKELIIKLAPTWQSFTDQKLEPNVNFYSKIRKYLMEKGFIVEV